MLLLTVHGVVSGPRDVRTYMLLLTVHCDASVRNRVVTAATVFHSATQRFLLSILFLRKPAG